MKNYMLETKQAMMIGSITLSADDFRRLVKERDAAVADLKYSRVCYTCKHKRTPVCDGCHVNLDKWEWRGVKEEEDATDRR